MVGVSHTLLCDLPSEIPVQILLVDEDSHELCDCNRGMCVIELDCRISGQLSPVVAGSLETPDDICKRACNEEVLLLESENLSEILGIVGVEYLTDVLCLDLMAHCLVVVSSVELLEAEFLKGLGAPESEGVDGLSAVTDDRHVIGHALDLVGIDPFVVVTSVLMDHFHAAAEIDRISEVRSGDFPRVAVTEPVVGLLELITVSDLLAEDSVVVSDSVAEGGDFKGCHRVQKACCKSSETSVSQSCIGLDVCQLFIGVSEILQGLGDLVLKSHVCNVVGHGPSHEELEGEVIDSLGLCRLLGFP